MVSIEEIQRSGNKALEEKYEMSLVLTKDEFERYLYSPKVEISNAYKEITKEYISKDLIRDILTNPAYFNRVIEVLFKQSATNFNVYEYKNGLINNEMHFNRGQFAYSLESLLSNNELPLDEELEERVTKIINICSLNQMYQDFEGKVFEIEIDKNDFSIKTSTLLYALFLTEDEFKNYANDIFANEGITPEEFAYALKEFVTRTRIESLYNIPIDIRRRIVTNTSYDVIDYESINKFTESADPTSYQITINESLLEKIFENMPDDLPLLQKAIRIYVKMCRTLTFDPEFYATDKVGVVAKRHQNLERIKTITPENNEIVCYEFIAIYSKLLQEIGINCKVVAEGSSEYGKSHSHLEFRVGKYLIKADPTSHFIDGDLLQAKIGKSLKSFYTLNKNNTTKGHFLGEVNQVLDDMKDEKEIKMPSSKKISEFNFALSAYRKEMKKRKINVTLTSKIDMLLKQISSAGFDYFDTLDYALLLKLLIFNDEERRNNIDCTIIKDTAADQKRLAMPVLIITINDDSFLDENEENIYLYFKPPTTLKVIKKEDIEILFDKETFGYVKSSTRIIPGIKVGGKR